METSRLKWRFAITAIIGSVAEMSTFSSELTKTICKMPRKKAVLAIGK